MHDARDHDPDSVDEPRWDANDPRRQKDCFAPPAEPCECYCLHCNRTYMSDQIWFQRIVGGDDKQGFDGFWMCPTPNCGGAGFTFDIFPTDPAHPANAGWTHDDDDEEYGEECFDEKGDYIEPENRVYNPEEPKYKSLDAELEGCDDDIEGEEWKLGLEPGQKPPAPQPSEEAQREMEAEEAKYNAPDERPRELDWSEYERKGGGGLSDDDIPY